MASGAPAGPMAPPPAAPPADHPSGPGAQTPQTPSPAHTPTALPTNPPAAAPQAPAGADEPTLVGGIPPAPRDYNEDAFDDFASLRDEPRQGIRDEANPDDDLDDIAARLGWGDDAPSTPDTAPKLKQINKYYLFAGAGAIVLLVVVALIMMLQADPPELTTTPRMPPVESSAPVKPPSARVDLGEPDVRGEQVVLTWKSNPETLDFAVLVTGPDGTTKTIVANREHTYVVPVDPIGGYCFQIQAFNSAKTKEVFYSQTRSIRGSDCRH